MSFFTYFTGIGPQLARIKEKNARLLEAAGRQDHKEAYEILPFMESDIFALGGFKVAAAGHPSTLRTLENAYNKMVNAFMEYSIRVTERRCRALKTDERALPPRMIFTGPCGPAAKFSEGLEVFETVLEVSTLKDGQPVNDIKKIASDALKKAEESQGELIQAISRINKELA